MSADLERLRALAMAAGGKRWEHVGKEWGDEGGSYEAIVDDTGETVMGEYGPSEEQAKHIAANGPAAVLELLDCIQALTNERNALIVERNDATMRAIKAENPSPLRVTAPCGERCDGTEQFNFLKARPEMADDELDDVLPLTSAALRGFKPIPVNLPASLDLPDTEGGACD